MQFLTMSRNMFIRSSMNPSTRPDIVGGTLTAIGLTGARSGFLGPLLRLVLGFLPDPVSAQRVWGPLIAQVCYNNLGKVVPCWRIGRPPPEGRSYVNVGQWPELEICLGYGTRAVSYPVVCITVGLLGNEDCPAWVEPM
jgi:hypothetical protein